MESHNIDLVLLSIFTPHCSGLDEAQPVGEDFPLQGCDVTGGHASTSSYDRHRKHGADGNDNIENPDFHDVATDMRGEMSSDYCKVW
jgi:hypothetical protein